MNRNVHLKESLPRNILNNISYPNLEFVVLNYGSKDDMHEWISGEMKAYIDMGLLKYYKADFPEYFVISHAKNMAFRLATGDILCSMDADNFSGPGFAAYINRLFNKNADIFLSPPGLGPDRRWWDVQGRICLWRKDFYHFRGYDEEIRDYGYEDKDFKQRMITGGCRKTLIRPPEYLQAISHSDQLRVSQYKACRQSSDLLITKTTEKTWDIIHLQAGNTFEKFKVAFNMPPCDEITSPDHIISSSLQFNLKQYKKGSYRVENNTIILFKKEGMDMERLTKYATDTFQSGTGAFFHREPTGNLRNRLLLERNCFISKKKFIKNKTAHNIINENGFGQGIVRIGLSENYNNLM